MDMEDPMLIAEFHTDSDVEVVCVVRTVEDDYDSVMKQLYTEEKQSPETEQPLEMEEPTEEMSKIHVILLNVSYYGLSTMFLALSVVVVPSQVQAMVGAASKGRWLGGIVASGAVTTLVFSPLIGMKSDRLVSRFGKRRPIMLAGTLMLILGLFGMAFSAPNVVLLRPLNSTSKDCSVDLVAQRCRPFVNSTNPLPHMPNIYNRKHNIPQEGSLMMPNRDHDVDQTNFAVEDEGLAGNIGLFVMFYMVLTSSFCATTVPYNALIADKSHKKQRGFNSGVMGFMILFGNISGAALGLFFNELGVFGIYTLLAALVLLCVLITIFSISEKPGKEKPEPLECKKVFQGYWEPLKEHDFLWVFFTRFLMQQGVCTVTGFLEYWLADMVELPFCWTPERSVAVLLLPLLLSAAILSVVGGYISDRIGRRKPLVITSALVMFIVTTVLAFIRGENAYYIALSLAIFFGAGFGAFQAVDFALVMDVLPHDKDKAKDIAVWHQAMILPQALATPVGGVVLDLFERVNCVIGLGYIILFLITAFYFFLSGIFVTKIRGVR